MSDTIDCCVVVPVRDHPDILADCLASLVPALTPASRAIVVDDGSPAALASATAIERFANDPRFEFLRHDVTQGPSASRNDGIARARALGASLVILLDADCLAEPDLITAHVAFHRAHPDVACRGGCIVGRGRGFWARLDAAMSWFTSMPGAPEGEIKPPYHLPTTNMCLTLAAFKGSELFDVRLRTGEDVAFAREVRESGHTIVFSERPLVHHRDRETLQGFLRHQYSWGLHTYVVRLRMQRLDLVSRLLFAAGFLVASPAYVALATSLNLKPLLRSSWRYALLTPFLVAVYAMKAVAVIVGTLSPRRALFPVAFND